MTLPRLLRSVTKHQYAIGDQLEVISVTESDELAVRIAAPNISADEAKHYAENKSLQAQLIKLTDERDQLLERLQDHRLFLKVMAKDVF